MNTDDPLPSLSDKQFNFLEGEVLLIDKPPGLGPLLMLSIKSLTPKKSIRYKKDKSRSRWHTRSYGYRFINHMYRKGNKDY